MATYLPGITDYIPEIQPFVPDYNFYSGALGMKQGKADVARQKLNNLYGSLLNAPLTREDNIKSREEFFKVIDQDIKKMATMDLSLEANEQMAKGIFNQMLDNKNIAKDMVWTKQFNNAVQRGESFKNCTDPEKCGGQWWAGGEQYLKFKKQEFIDAAPDQAMTMGAPDYVPYQNVMEKAMKIAKEADLNVTQDINTGQFIFTKKNGELVEGALQSLLAGTLGKDPLVNNYYNAKAYVDRKNYTYSNEQKFGSKEAAEAGYISNIVKQYEKPFRQQEENLKTISANTQGKINKLNAKLKTARGRDKESIVNMIQTLQQEKDSYDASLEQIKETNGAFQSGKLNETFSPQMVDGIYAQSLLLNDIGNAAGVMSLKGAESTMRVNQYSLENVRFKNRMLLEDLRFKNDIKAMEHKFKLDKWLQDELLTGGAEGNVPETVANIPGAADVGEKNTLGYEFNNRGFNAFKSDREGARLDLSASERSLVGAVASTTFKEAERGDAQAKQDYVELVSNYLEATAQDAGSIVKTSTADLVRGEGQAGAKPNVNPESMEAYRAMNRATNLDEKYAIAKGIKMDPNAISGSQVDHLYDKTVSRMLARNKDNEYLRDYLEPIVENSRDLRMNINTKNRALEQMDQWYAETAKQVANDAATSGEYGQDWADAFASYIDNDGHAVEENTFVNNMMARGHSEEKAREMYRGDEKADPGFWDYVWSGADAMGTTALGLVGLTPPGWLINYLQDEDPETGEKDWIGWDYDTPTDVANWKGFGADEEKNISGYANPGLHDAFRRAFAKYAEPEGDRSWLGLTGAGDSAAMGLRFEFVDPKSYRSNGFQGSAQIMKDALSLADSGSSVFSFGGFRTDLPDNNAKAKDITNQVYRSMMLERKKNNRPILDVTYSNVAAGSANKVALNYKLNPEYVNRYKSTKNQEKLIPQDMVQQLTDEGITIYVDKDKTNNIFTEGTKQSSLEKMMAWTGELDLDYNQNYVQDFKIESDPTTGNYKTYGHIMTGLDDNGNPLWDYYENYHGFNTNLNDLVVQYDNLIYRAIDQNKAIEKNWLLQQSGR